MFKVLYNQARIKICIQPITPILIKSGRESLDPTLPAMEFVRTRTVAGEVPYIPGSSFKGVVRSHAEQILRTLDLDTCDITIRGEDCVNIRKQGDDKKMPYKEHCYACRTFGSTELASHTRFCDAYPWHPGASQDKMESGAEQIITETRTNVMIDRRKGTAAGGSLFDLEVVSSGNFYGEIIARNYQLWQIALLALVLRDIQEGYQRLGGLKSRGFGWVNAQVEDFAFQQLGALACDKDAKSLRGVGSIKALEQEYGLIPKDELTIASEDATSTAPESIIATTIPRLRTTFVPEEGKETESWNQLADALVSGDNWKKMTENGRRMQ